MKKGEEKSGDKGRLSTNNTTILTTGKKKYPGGIEFRVAEISLQFSMTKGASEPGGVWKGYIRSSANAYIHAFTYKTYH